MTHPNDARPSTDRQQPATGYLVLDEGERLEVEIGGGEVVLRLPASRAYDLSYVLDAYDRLADLAAVTTEISATEQSLGRALRDAAVAAGHRDPQLAAAPKVDPVAPILAMAQLQEACPDLSHSTASAIIDAATWLIEQEEEYDVAGVLDAITLDGTGAGIYLTLVGYHEDQNGSQSPSPDEAGA